MSSVRTLCARHTRKKNTNTRYEQAFNAGHVVVLDRCVSHVLDLVELCNAVRDTPLVVCVCGPHFSFCVSCYRRRSDALLTFDFEKGKVRVWLARLCEFSCAMPSFISQEDQSCRVTF
ncbi:hypothetical protein TRVL_06399 [Trypanosoma vivax]|nr:hypothetical protein TRVL_06399 [Trypanosoma vivax]